MIIMKPTTTTKRLHMLNENTTLEKNMKHKKDKIVLLSCWETAGRCSVYHLNPFTSIQLQYTLRLNTRLRRSCCWGYRGYSYLVVKHALLFTNRRDDLVHFLRHLAQEPMSILDACGADGVALNVVIVVVVVVVIVDENVCDSGGGGYR